MVIRGNSRGNAHQLSRYLLTMKDNEAIRILDIDGLEDGQPEDLHRAVFAMGISAELSKSDKALYHAQINPAIGEDAAMDDAAWLRAGDMLGQQLGLEGQRRAIVLHSKKGRTHAHVVWERYDHEKEKMVSDSFSRLAQDRARKEMEQAFGHEPTPHRNKHRPELKANLTRLWNQTNTGAEFVAACRNNNYYIATGSGRSPYVVVDERGHSFDLARQLKDVKLRDVRQRLRHEDLMSQQTAIITARNAAASSGERNARSGGENGKQSYTFTHPKKTSAMNITYTYNDGSGKDAGQRPDAKADNKPAFGENKADITQQAQPEQPHPDAAKPDPAKDFAQGKGEVTGQQPLKSIQEKFAENRDDATKSKQGKKTDTRREEFNKRMQDMEARNAKDKNKGLDMG